MLEFLMLGEISFWVIVSIEFFWLLNCADKKDAFAPALTSFVAFGFILHVFNFVNIVQLVTVYQKEIALSVVAYFLVGLIWLTFKWINLVRKQLVVYDQTFVRFCIKNNLPENTKVLPKELRADWKRYAKNEATYKQRSIAEPPQIKNYYKEAINWTLLWPFSMLSYLFKDLLKDFFDFIWRYIVNYLQAVSDYLFSRSDIKENLIDDDDK